MSVSNLGIVLILLLSIINLQTSEARTVAHWVHNQLPELVGFESCTELKQHLGKVSQKYQERPYTRHGRFSALGAAEKMVSKKRRLQRQEVAATAPAGKAAVDMTQTNNQVQGVDEADFVKFNGSHIFQLSNGSLKILKAWPANELSLVSSINIQGQAREMLLSRDYVVAVSGLSGKTVVNIVGIGELSRPIILAQYEVHGQYVTGRKIRNTIRLIVRDHSSSLNWHYGHRYKRHSNMENNPWIQGQKNQSDIALNQLLRLQPTYKKLNGFQSQIDVLEDCSHVYVPKEFPIYSPLTRIITIDFQKRSYAEALAFTNSQTVYASKNALYLAQNGWEQDTRYNSQKTAIYKFDLRSEKNTSLVAWGKVNGKLINQFALDEHKSYLRVATNSNEYVKQSWIGTHREKWAMVNRMQVLKQRGKKLKVIGKSQPLAEGERIYSVRFDGKRGFLVTFRQVDPLFTLDLSNPYQPHAVGELKVPGFSTYIHMLGDNRLLTIGRDADEKTGRSKGLKLSLFDVSNFKKPKEINSLLFVQNATSEADYEHKAFNYYAKKGVLAIPMQLQENSFVRKANISRSALLLFKITNKEILPSGELDMANTQTRRSFFVGDFVYAIGNTSVRVASINKPAEILANLDFMPKMAKGW